MNENTELDALIVEHISDLEAALRRINESIDKRLLREASEIMEKRSVAQEWAHEFLPDDEGRISVAPRGWISQRGGGEDEWLFWFELSWADAGGQLITASHVGEFLDLEGGSGRKALWVNSNVVKRKRDWCQLLNNQPATVKALRDLGFDVDGNKGTISIPVRLDAKTLKQGFAEDDLEEALTPINAAFDLAVKAAPHVQTLVDEATRGEQKA